VVVKLNGETKGAAEHLSKKKAEQIAAQRTFEMLGLTSE
jgi:dsRNA-specific ribonuclease